MIENQAISAFSALAQGTRLAIVRLLIKAGEAGLPSGELATRAKVSTASMSFHLGQLEQAGLVSSKRLSRQIIYSVAYDQLGALITYLMEDCCGGDSRVKACC
jgi:ArsR family transcriptional regulator, arsenate/arsenite/antimonite-responsive transcriptional repressor